MDNPWVLEPVQMTLRLVLALVLGGAVGLEREQSNHAAGFRTHILVCLGSCLIMLLSIYGFGDFANEPNVRLDPARLAAQVITGIGFLGAGTIVFNGNSISGLTTAASLWVVAAIGLATGAGFYFAAIVSTLFVLASLWVLNKVEKRWMGGKKTRQFRIDMQDRPGGLASISSILSSFGADIRKLAIEQFHPAEPGADCVRVIVLVRTSKPGQMIEAADQLRQLAGVTNVSLE